MHGLFTLSRFPSGKRLRGRRTLPPRGHIETAWQGRGTHVGAAGRPPAPRGEATALEPPAGCGPWPGAFSHPSPTANLAGVRRGSYVARSTTGRHRAELPVSTPLTG